MDIRSIRTTSLGDATYIVRHGTHAIVVDPQRDIDRFRDEIGDLTLTHVLETHVHNDYISGGRTLAAETGADLVLPAGSGAGFAFVPAFHLEEFESGPGFSIRPLHTPGHTPEHTSYLVLVDGVPTAVFTGGSLLVGAAGRSDLLGVEYAEQLSTLQYGSLQRLAQLPDETGVYPTHGEGSFCTASGAGRTTSTIAQEKAENPLYRFTTASEFVANQLDVLVPYPTYYAHMGPANRLGPDPMPDTTVPQLSPDDVTEHVAAGGTVVDVRDRHAFAAGHLPGSIGIEYGDSFAPWAGWVLDYNAPLVLVADADQDPSWGATELGRIGFEKVRGVLRGVEEWRASGRDLASYQNVTIGDLTSAMASDPDLQVVDVRDPKEWEAGHLPGSVHHYVPDFDSTLPTGIDPGRPMWLVCRTGNRASIAAGMVERLGGTPIVVATGGVPDALVRTASAG